MKILVPVKRVIDFIVRPRLKVIRVAEPPARQAGETVGSVDELVARLKTLGVVA
jgi:electron transfer flavoprotein beta subunit